MPYVTCPKCHTNFFDTGSRCPSCGWNEPPWQYEFAWRWFDMHVKHRNTMFNYWLVSMGIFASAYAFSINHGDARISFWIALATVLLSLFFWYLHLITLVKIQRGKDAMLELSKQEPLYSLFGKFDEGSTKFKWAVIDPVWTGLVHILIAWLAAVAVVDAEDPKDVPRWLFPTIVFFLAFVPMVCVIIKWFLCRGNTMHSNK